MKCHLTIPAMLSNGEVKRPERPCPHDLHDLREDGFASCPYHGLVLVVVDDLTGKFKKQRCPFCGSKVNPVVSFMIRSAEAKANGKKKSKREGYPRKPKSRG